LIAYRSCRKHDQTGGRKKGSLNKRTKEIEIEAQGITTLQYMLKVMRDPKADPYRRDNTAPFVHARRNSQEQKR
jgi:hypothetical protein